MTGSGFVPPPYPYDRLADLAAAAAERFGEGPAARGSAGVGGMVDCSIGTPCDPPPAEVVAALATSGAERGYPASAGSAPVVAAAREWLGRRFGVDLSGTESAMCVGTKEFVASLPHLLRLADPARDTVLHPETAYPSYAMGAQLAGCRSVAVPEDASGAPDLSAISEEDARRALLLWANVPSNPTGACPPLGPVVAWARERGVPVFSDECYADFVWRGEPESALAHGPAGVVAVHSLSKRSNLAGLRVGSYTGDPDLVRFLVEVRRHGGLMVPGPVQAAAVVAYGDDGHVEVQRDRYRSRLALLADALGAAGVPAGLPEGGFYLWVRAPGAFGDGWGLARALAEQAGLLASPGEFYGPAGAGHVRIAVVQPTERLELVAERLARAGDLVPPGIGPTAEGRTVA